MTLDEQIAVMQAFRDGAEIEYECRGKGDWEAWDSSSSQFNFDDFNYRIAPKKERDLVVEQLREWGSSPGKLIQRAADEIVELRLAVHNRDNRIEELENIDPLLGVTTDELLEELKRRIGK